jgi:hypothetical protein
MWKPATAQSTLKQKTAKFFKHTGNKRGPQVINKEHKELSEQNT